LPQTLHLLYQGAFEQAEFEYARNQMAGSFDYKSLDSRLQKIREIIDEETKVLLCVHVLFREVRLVRSQRYIFHSLANKFLSFIHVYALFVCFMCKRIPLHQP
jgi:hypothetical protein